MKRDRSYEPNAVQRGSHFSAPVNTVVGGTWVLGAASTPDGYVHVYAENTIERQYVMLRFIRDGREYERRYKGKWSERGIAVAAGRFAREVAS